MKNDLLEQWDRETFFIHRHIWQNSPVAMSPSVLSPAARAVTLRTAMAIVCWMPLLACIASISAMAKPRSRRGNRRTGQASWPIIIPMSAMGPRHQSRCQNDPGSRPDHMSKVYFGLSGSDANETNIKLVWYYNNILGRPEKKKIISRWRGYHGSGLMTGSLTGLNCFTKI